MSAYLILSYMKVGLKAFANEIAKDKHKISETNTLIVKMHQFHRQIFSESSTCLKETLGEILRCVLAIFKEMNSLRDMEICRDMVKKIKEIGHHEVIPGGKEETKIFTELVSELNKQIDVLKDRQLKTVAVSVDKSVIVEYKCIQKEVREIEDTCNKLRGFIDLEIIQETETMREELCSIVKVSKEIYFEAKQRKTKTKNTPGRPYVVANELGRVEVAWGPPLSFIKQSSYEVLFYKGSSEEHKKYVQCKECTEVLTILKGDTDFTCKVRRVVNDDIGPSSETSTMIRTVRPAGQKYLNTATCYKQGNPTVYTLPMKENNALRNKEAHLRTFEIGSPENDRCEMRVIVLRDARRALDYILNFALGISRGDGYIFTVNDRDTFKNQEQHEYISEYVIYPEEGSRITHTLALIDIPGLMNCYKMERDETTVQNLQALFSTGVGKRSGSIDAICVFVNVDDFELTRVQRIIVERALALFGKDLKDNLCLVSTCTDENEQIALTAKTLNIPEVLFADFASPSSSEAFWDRNLSFFRKFLQFIGKMQTCTFTMSKEVLDARLRLKEISSVLERKINVKNQAEDLCESLRKILTDIESDIHRLNSEINSINDLLREKELR